MRTPIETCGSGLARDGGVSGSIDIDCAGHIASKLAPTVILGAHRFCIHHINPVGAGLPAMAVGQAPAMLTVLA